MKKLFIFSMLCLLMAFGFSPEAKAQYDPCAITTFPYTEGFESGSMESCYNVNSLGIINGYLYPQVFAASDFMPAHSGNYFLRCYNNLYSDTAAQVPTLILPPVEPRPRQPLRRHPRPRQPRRRHPRRRHPRRIGAQTSRTHPYRADDGLQENTRM